MSFLRGAIGLIGEVEEGTKSNLSQWHSMIDDSVKLWNLGMNFLKNNVGVYFFGNFLRRKWKSLWTWKSELEKNLKGFWEK